MRPRLLLCGFTAFPGIGRNPAAAIVEAIAEQGWSPLEADLDTLLLPVTWDGAAQAVASRLAERPADGVLVIGVARGAECVRVERWGRNRACADSLDASGRTLGRALVCDDGPASLQATAPVEALIAAIRATGLECQASDDAGDYLCNFTLYRLLLDGSAPAGFVHIPQALDENAPVTLAELDAAVKAAVTAFAQTKTPARDRAGVS